MKQSVGERRLSRQTALLMSAWELLPDQRRDVFLEVAKSFKDAIASSTQFNFNREDSLNQEDEEDHFFGRFQELLNLRCHYLAEKASARTQGDVNYVTYVDERIEENRTELNDIIEMLVETIEGIPKSKKAKKVN